MERTIFGIELVISKLVVRLNNNVVWNDCSLNTQNELYRGDPTI